MVNISQGAIAIGVLTLLFGGDIYSMFAAEPAEVSAYRIYRGILLMAHRRL